MDKPWKVIFAFIAVFMAGAVFGGLFTLRASGKRLGDWRAQDRNVVALPNVSAATPATNAAPKTGATVQTPRALFMPALMRQFTQRLKLTSAQRERVKPIVGRASEDLQRLRQENEADRQRNLADTVRVTDRMYTDVSALLSPDQREELEAMRGQMQQRVEKDRKHRAEVSAQLEAALKAERANAKQAIEGDGKTPNATPVSVPAAKPTEKGK